MKRYTLKALLLFLILIPLAVSACSTVPAIQEDTAATDQNSTPSAVAIKTEANKTPLPSLTPVSLDSPSAVLPLLLEDNIASVAARFDLMRASGDEQYIPVLIELLRAGQIGIVQAGSRAELVFALETLSGENFGYSWAEWIEWYGNTDITPPTGFTEWKGEILARVDPNFVPFFNENQDDTFRIEELVWGGVLVDGIPALDHATQIDAAAATYLDPAEPVFGLSINGDQRAYPLRIIDWHEMANDTVGGTHVSIAYCTLCGAAVAYNGEANDGNTYTFGSSGFLYRSNKLMYDHNSRSLWNQLSGEPVMGDLVGSGIELEILPIVLTTWEDWQDQHPDTTVLDINTGYNRTYELGAAYGDYFASAGTMFPVWQRSDLLADKSHIYAIRINGEPKAYPIETLVEEKISHDTFAGQDIVLITSGDIVEANGLSSRIGEVNYTTGAQVRAYASGGHTFTQGDIEAQLLDENGTIWAITEDALISETGDKLERLGGHLAYWFGWFAFFPNTAVYGVSG